MPILILALVLLVPVSWVFNFVALTNCDFESPYKCEVIHGAGLVIIPASVVTVWFDSDETD